MTQRYPNAEGLPPEHRAPLAFERDDAGQTCRVELPDVAKTLQVLGEQAYLRLTVTDRLQETTRT